MNKVRLGLRVGFLAASLLAGLCLPGRAAADAGPQEDPPQVFLPLVARPLPESQLLVEMPVWRALFLIYRSIDADYINAQGVPSHLTYTLTGPEIDKGLWAMRDFPAIAEDFSGGEVIVDYDVVIVDEPLQSVSALSPQNYWLSPSDTAAELDRFAPDHSYDSIIIYWPDNNPETGEEIPSYGWGWGMQASGWSNDATYAIVSNAPDWRWGYPVHAGQVFLHEWLHGVCVFYDELGYRMPSGCVDGGGSHGYSWDPLEGWAAFYRDLMTGEVLENGALTGLTPDAWREGSIRGEFTPLFADYFTRDSRSGYLVSGSAVWDPDWKQITLGGVSGGENRLVRPVTFSGSAVISAQVYIAEGYAGLTGLAARSDGLEYRAVLEDSGQLALWTGNTRGETAAVDLISGWYTLKLRLDSQAGLLQMKAWRDGQPEPGWQAQSQLQPGFVPRLAGFYHAGAGVVVDNLLILQEP